MLKKEIEKSYKEGINVFITGMSRGVDTWAAEIVLKLRRKHRDIKLICAIPYPEFDQKWITKDKRKYKKILWLSA